MDERVLVEVYVPAVQKRMEFFIPLHQQISLMKQVITIFLEEVWNLEEKSLFTLNWYAVEKQCYLKQELSLHEKGIRSGETILFI